MGKEADQRGRVSIKPRELVSSAGFSVEYENKVFDQELREDIVSYLGEYRFKLQKYNYQLIFSKSGDEGWKLRDTHRLEAMGTKAARSIEERRLRKESTYRETAEAAGIEYLEMQLITAKDGDSVVWASPPGDEKEGYGPYGFFYIGKVKKNEDKKEISMAAIRVDNPTVTDFNRAFQELSGTESNFSQAEDFISKPVITSLLPEDLVDKILSRNFSLRNDPLERERFNLAMQILNPRIDQLVKFMRFGSIEERKKAFHALENFALEVKRDLEIGSRIIFEPKEEFASFVHKFGYEPPKVKGSCPIKSSNIFEKYQTLNSFLEGEGFVCPKCGQKALGPVGDQCPGCGITKEQYAIETGQTPCE